MASKVKGMFEGWDKWKIALAVGAPVALGVAALWYYKHCRNEDMGKHRTSTGDESLSPPTIKQLLEKAQEAKNKGNKSFKVGKYDAAILYYTEAIQICPQENKPDMSTFYQNRAAAYDHLKNYAEVIADCSKAIELNSRYTKAFLRRAKAHEHLGQLLDSLMDLTAVCILESFKNPSNLQMADRILKELGKSQAKKAFQDRVPTNPSRHFIRNYFNGFANDPVLKWTPSSDDVPSEDLTIREDEITQTVSGDDNKIVGKDKPYELSPFHKARESVLKDAYDDIVTLCTKEIDTPGSLDMALALLLRATFYILRGELELAKTDLNRVIENETLDKKIRVNALIKRGSLLMQEEKQTESLDDFATAVRIDPENCDVFHHRGQQNLMLDRVKDAKQDFDRSIQLNPQHAISHVQKCYGDYKDSLIFQNPVQLQMAVKNLSDVIAKFPQSPDAHLLYAQALTDEMKYDEADRHFEEASRIDPENAQTIVHRGLLILQWKQDIEAACQMIEEAIKVDPKCEFAYETLGTLQVQRGDMKTALELFQTAIDLSRTEMEMSHIFSLKNAAIAQVKVAATLGIELPSVSSLI